MEAFKMESRTCEEEVPKAPYVEKFDDFDYIVEEVAKAPYNPMSLHLQEFDM